MRRLFLTAAACTLAVCAAACSWAPRATGSTGPTASAQSAGNWTRVIAPFAVEDGGGRAYRHPFLGGLDVPRPQFLDIDGDGDLDLFVHERSDELMFFENTGSPQRAEFTWRTDRFHDLAVGEWARFVDIDRDGDFDLVAEQPFSHMRLYRNDGTRQQPRFAPAADSLRDVTGLAIFADRQNIPHFTDLDCDDRYDLFIGRVEGTIARYEEVDQRNGVPRFELVSERFENIEIIGQMSGGVPSMRHGANAMYFADLDRDSDLDFFWGDFFEPGVLYIENTGSCRAPSLSGRPANVRATNDSLMTSGYNVPVLVDIDADMDLDLFVGVLGGAFNPNRTAADNFLFYQRDAQNGFTLRTRRFLDGLDLGTETMPAAADIDGDGDLDLVIGNKNDPATLRTGRLYVLRNTGSARAPAFRVADTLELAAAYHYAPALGDLDGDDDPDLLLGTWNQGVLFLRNEGTRQQPRWVQDSTLTIPLTRGSNATPALADFDGDGDLDLFVGEASGEINYLRNAGTPRAPRFELVSEAVAGIDAGRRSIPSLFDYDADGDLDLMVGRETRGIAAYRNQGGAEPRFAEDAAFQLPLPNLAAPLWLDLDGDRTPELVTGSISGGLLYFRQGGEPRR